MPRKRPRSTNKCSWTVDELKGAIDAVRDGQKLREVARKFKIPVTTLYDRLKSGCSEESKMGRKCIFSPEEEREIASHLILLSRQFYGLTPIEFRRIVYQYAEKKNIKHSFNSETKLAGKDWLYNFMERNRDLSFRKPEATSLNRIMAFNKTEVDRCYANLILVFDKHHFSPGRIFNVDESGLTTVQKPDRIIAQKGVKQIGSATSWKRGENITLCCCMSAAGFYIHPMFIFPRLRMHPSLERNGPPGSFYSCSKNGWMTEELFQTWLIHFTKTVHPTPEDTVLIILDNHCSHTSLKIYEYCRLNNITLLSIPPHSSHRLQPLDLTFFGPLKTAYNHECNLYMKSHPFQKITPADIPSLVTKAYGKVATLEKAINGFSAAGIFPLDTDKFKDYDFNASENLVNIEKSASLDPSKDVHPCQSNVTIGEVPGTSGILSAQNKPTPTDNNTKISDISPVPNLSSQISNTNNLVNKRAKQHSEILTSTPMKEKFEIAARKKNEKEQKSKEQKQNNKVKKQKQKIRKRKLFDDSSSDESMEGIENLCNDDELDDVPGALNQDFCSVCGEFGKNNEIWFRCVLCSHWAHKDCSGWDEPDGYYLCDICIKK